MGFDFDRTDAPERVPSPRLPPRSGRRLRDPVLWLAAVPIAVVGVVAALILTFATH
jgi:hypothetical protein